MPIMSDKNIQDAKKAIDYFIEISKNGNITEKDLPTLYGDGTRWSSLTLKGFIASYHSYIEALQEVTR